MWTRIAGALVAIAVIAGAITGWETIAATVRKAFSIADKAKLEQVAGDFYSSELRRLERQYWGLLDQYKRTRDPGVRAKMRVQIHGMWEDINDLRRKSRRRPLPPPF